MSGIVGLIHTNRAPIDPSCLRRMTEVMTFRGPDAQTVWSQGFVGFGHTLLQTTWESAAESQPFTLDRQVWIVADARIDDRQTLTEKLGLTHRANGEQILTDIELILRAYLHWGDDCVQHLLGDFAFGIWDDRTGRLFCAGDQMGVKLFYYSQVSNCLLFSNTIACLRQHPQVSSGLNDRTIGDLLLFDLNHHPTTTVFADIQRLPPAHTLTWSLERGLQTRQYWTMPVPEIIRYKNSQDYLDRFQELMSQAVGDRLRTDRVASFLSGGLDSTTIAATALAVARQRNHSLDLKAFTVVYDTLIPDRERYYAGLAAASLGIPIDYQVADDYTLYQGHSSELLMPAPYNNPLESVNWERSRRVAAHSRVVFCGDGGDESLTPSSAIEMLKTMPLFDVGSDLSRAYFGFGVRPHWGSGLLGRLRRGQNSQPAPAYPQWLNPDFARSLDLEQRWSQIVNQPEPLVDSPRSPAYHKVNSILWAALFETNDPGHSGVPVEVRLPFIDLRLVDYLLALPSTPWCTNKTLLRMANIESLPAEIRLRPKTPLAGDPLTGKVLQPEERVSISNMLRAVDGYIHGGDDLLLAQHLKWEDFIPISFAYWFDRHLHLTPKDTHLIPSTSRHDTS